MIKKIDKLIAILVCLFVTSAIIIFVCDSSKADTCTVYGQIVLGNGDSLQGAIVVFTMNATCKDTSDGLNKIIPPHSLYDTTDYTGRFSVPLLQTGQFDPPRKWEMKVKHHRISGSGSIVTFGIPSDSNSIDVAKLPASNFR